MHKLRLEAHADRACGFIFQGAPALDPAPTSAITVNACPFCGWHDVQIDETSPGRYQVTCPECEAIGPASEVSVDMAVMLWNVRQPT